MPKGDEAGRDEGLIGLYNCHGASLVAAGLAAVGLFLCWLALPPFRDDGEVVRGVIMTLACAGVLILALVAHVLLWREIRRRVPEERHWWGSNEMWWDRWHL